MKKNYKSLFRLAAEILFLLLSTNSSLADERSVKFEIKKQSFGGGGIYLSAIFRGKTIKMLLDTGASSTYILPAHWNMSLPVLGTKVALGINGIPSSCSKLDLSDLQIVSSIGPVISNKPIQGLRCQENNGDNIMGINYLYGSIIELDFRKGIMSVLDRSSELPPMTDFIKLKNGNGVLGLPLTIGSTKIIGLLDTGATISAVDSKYVDCHKQDFEIVEKNSYSSEGSGKNISVKLYKIRNLAFGETNSLHNIYAISYDFSSLQQAFGPDLVMIIGYNVINRFPWTFDLRSESEPMWRIKYERQQTEP
jgi:hypothetical protein